MSQQQDDQQRGLRWVQKGWDLEPQWTAEPSPEAIKQAVDKIRSSQESQITFLADGAFKKMYTVHTPGQEDLIMNVSLPVDPQHKTSSEVATLQWVKQNTSLPVPEVIEYQANREESTIGFEWVLTTALPSKPLSDSWRSLSYTTKQNLVTQIATHSSHIFRHKLTSIGNLYPDPPSTIDRIITTPFIWGPNSVSHSTPRGPFPTSHAYLSARLAVHKTNATAILTRNTSNPNPNPTSASEDEDEDEIQDANRTLTILTRLHSQLPNIFPSDPTTPEPSLLSPDNLHAANILIDESGTITGVRDWECVPHLPLWQSCTHPPFLLTKPRHSFTPSAYDSSEENTLYWEHLNEYECTKLRAFYLQEMERLEPEWIKVYERSEMQRDFDFAVRNCDDGFLAGIVERWIGGLEKWAEGGRKEGGLRSMDEVFEEDQERYRVV